MSLARSSSFATRLPLARLIGGLGVGQIIGWGSTFYLPTILARDISRDTGLSDEVVFGGVTVMLLVGAALSPSMGRWLDRGGARMIMTLGSLATALSLCLLGLAVGTASYLFAWGVMGFSSAMLLTNPSFVAVAQIAGSEARKAMTFLMLFTGASSSFAWPVLGVLDGSLGWRATCFALAGFQLLVGAPFHWWLLDPKLERGTRSAAATVAAHVVSEGIVPERRSLAMALLIPCMCLTGFISWGLSVHIVELLGHLGAGREEAIWLASLLGVLQVSARLVDLAIGSRHSPLATGITAAGLLSSAFAVALVPRLTASPALTFMLVYGIASGAMSLARVMMPLMLFGSRSYGRASGVLAAFQNVAYALAPLVYAALFERAGTALVLWLSLAAGLVAMLGLVVLDRLRR